MKIIFVPFYDMIWHAIFVNCKWVYTRCQQYSTHLHINNRENGTKQTIYRTTQKFCLSLRVLPWHLPYNWRKKHGQTSVRVAEDCLWSFLCPFSYPLPPRFLFGIFSTPYWIQRSEVWCSFMPCAVFSTLFPKLYIFGSSSQYILCLLIHKVTLLCIRRYFNLLCVPHTQHDQTHQTHG
jgi:hypothetical protein